MEYINNIPVSNGEITIITSDHAEATMKHSAQLAAATQKAGANVLVVNCGMADRRYKNHLNENYKHSGGRCKMLMYSSVCGDLVGETVAIEQIIREAKIGVLIISGWEFASSNYRRKQNLMYYLRALMSRLDIPVIIYCHNGKAPVAGKIDKGGIGQITFLSSFIVKLESSEQMEEAIKKPTPLLISGEDMAAAERSAQLLINKVNKLQGVNSGLRSLESDEGVGGVLVPA